jgi:UTP--glucose-1-phosphate uridylyltransferase
MKAVIPAAGLGTRLLPATKSMPKEMLPVVDKPVIQYVVEEAVAAGCEEILIVTGRGKRSIEDHFDHSFELEHHLKEKGKKDLLEEMERISEMADIQYVRQKVPKGLGHAVLCAKKFIRDEPFAVLLGDDIFHGATPCTKQLVDIHSETRCSVFAVKDVPREEIGRYGAVSGEAMNHKKGLYRVQGIIEKPKPDEAPSTLATMGRYVFTADILDELEQTQPGHGGEIQLTDAMATLAEKQMVYAWEFEGKRLDVGSVEGFLEANLALGLERQDIKGKVQDLLDRFLGAQSARLG